MRWILAVLMGVLALAPQGAAAQRMGWATVWAASVQGPYPVGNPSAQPDLRYAIPEAGVGAREMTMRLVVRPSLWGRQARLRFSNAFGTRPLTLEGVHLGMQSGGAGLVRGTNRLVRFDGQRSVTIPPGGQVWSDPVPLSFARASEAPLLEGRKLAISLHVVGESGPMTWHAKALQTSYLTAPGAGARGHEDGEASFPYSTTSWFFLDAVDMMAPAGTPVVVAFGDSITDGTASTLNGDDRWPDILARRLQAAHPNRVAVVNAGIGGNQVAGPAEYAPNRPFPGGPSAVSRLERDVASLSGVTTVVWMEGLNDFSRNGNAPIDAVIGAMQRGVAQLRQRVAGVRVVGATLTPALGSTSPAHGFAEQDEKRKVLNAFIRDGGLFDATLDFDAPTRDPESGGLRREMVPESTTGGPGDGLHPNRAGYLAMAQAVPLSVLLPGLAGGLGATRVVQNR